MRNTYYVGVEFTVHETSAEKARQAVFQLLNGVSDQISGYMVGDAEEAK